MTKLTKTEVTKATALHTGDTDARALEGSHFITHPATGQYVLVVSVDKLASRTRVWVVNYARYNEFAGPEGGKGLWNRPTEEVRAAAEELLVLKNGVMVAAQ